MQVPRTSPSKESRRVRFDELATLVNDRVDNPAESGVERYVGLEHLEADSLRIRQWGEITDVESTKLRFRPGDIIFGKRRVYQRKLAVADFEGICSAHAMVLRAKPEAVHPQFLPYFMQSDMFMERALAISVGSLSPTINWRDLAQQEFALPPIEEQRRLAIALRAIAALMEGNRVACGRLLAMRESLASYWWGTSASEFSPTRLESVCLKVQDGTHFSPKSKDGPFLYITSKNIRDGFLELTTAGRISREEHEPIYRRCDVVLGDLLLTKDGANAGNIAINTISEPVSLLSSVAMLRPDSSRVSAQYLFEFLRSAVGRAQLLSHVKGSAITRLTLEQIRGFQVPMCNLQMQSRVVNSFGEVSRGATLLSERAERVRLMRLQVRAAMETP